MRVFQIAVSVTISFILWVILYFNLRVRLISAWDGHHASSCKFPQNIPTLGTLGSVVSDWIKCFFWVFFGWFLGVVFQVRAWELFDRGCFWTRFCLTLFSLPLAGDLTDTGRVVAYAGWWMGSVLGFKHFFLLDQQVGDFWGTVAGDFPEVPWMVTLRGTGARRDAVRGMNPTAMVLHRYSVGVNGVLGFKHFFCSTNDCYDLWA